jgi:hypothetical protein
MKIDTMSRNIVRILKLLSKNDMLVRLIANNQDNPLSHPVTLQTKDLINPRADDAKFLPFPFDVEAQTEDGSFVRIYYNQGEFNEGETISEAQLNIDIIVAKSLWLIYDDTKKESLIRPYEIMERIVDLLGRKGIGDIRLEIDGYQHLYINTKFDCIRLYCQYTSLETLKKDSR